MQTGTQQNLADKLKVKVKAERLKTEQIFKDNLEKLSKNLQESSQKELNTIKEAIQTQTYQARSNLNSQYKILSKAFGKRLVIETLVTLAILTGLILASWGLLKGLVYQTHKRVNYLNKIEAMIKQEETTLQYIQEDTFGIDLMIESKSNFIVIPEGYTIETSWHSEDRKSIRLVKN